MLLPRKRSKLSVWVGIGALCFVYYAGASSIWAQSELAKLLASDGAADDLFGFDVDVDGDIYAVGSPDHDHAGVPSSGAVYVYLREGTEWIEEQELVASDAEAGDDFGWSVAVGGDRVIVGAPSDSTTNGINSGSAYVFRREGTTWIEEFKILASDGVGSDEFGWSVAFDADENLALIGARGVATPAGASAGAAYVFRREGLIWIEEAKLTASGQGSAFFGWSVGIDGDYAIIGAPAASSVYTFRWDGTSWIEEGPLPVSGGGTGFSVSIAEDVALVGAHLDDQVAIDAGAVHVFRREPTQWVEEETLLASDGTEDALFGYRVSTTGEHAIVAAPGDPSAGINSGSAYFFAFAGGSWIEETKLTPTDGMACDVFGVSASLEGDFAILGSFAADLGIDSGAAYVYRVISSDFARGDADANGTFNGLVDGLFTLAFQFIPGSAAPPCMDAADADDSGTFNGLIDALFMLNFQFIPGSPPIPPPTACGEDPTDDPLGCNDYPCP